MDLFTRVYFNAVFGGLGGLLGWTLFSLFSARAVPEDQLLRELAVQGAFVGAGIGYFVVSVDAIRDRSWLRFARPAVVGLALGALGGAVGMLVANWVNSILVGNIGAIRGDPVKFAGAVVARGLGFLFLGTVVGASEGIAHRSMGKFTYGSVGGTLGGFLGGCLFGVVYLSTLDGGGAALSGAAGFVVMGACIGALSALVRGVFQPASLKVMRGWQEGREYALDRDSTLVGRDEAADIALFRDMRVEKKHAVIRRDGERYVLVNNGAPADTTRVNDVPVSGTVALNDNDRIQLGNILLRFQSRAAVNRAKAAKAT